MSMLSNQADELRGYALSVRSVALRTTNLCHEARRDLFDSAVRMEQAADTIISLSDKLQGVMGTRYCKLFGTPERAARIVVDMCAVADSCAGCPLYSITPDGVCGDYYALLEWLGGDA